MTDKISKRTKNKLTLSTVVKNIFWFLCVCCVGFMIFFLIAQIGVYKKNNELKQILSHKEIADGLIIKTGSMKGSYVIVEFYFDNKRYEKKESSYSDDIEKGQRFKVMFDKYNPNNSQIIYDSPFFKTTDKTSITSGKILQKEKYTLRFEYQVQNKKYKKFQKVITNKYIDEDRVYSVEYDINNPKIALIKLD